MSTDRVNLLAERHRKVLRLYGQRYRAKEIARELSLTENSVNTYLTEAVQILEVGGRKAAADALARHEGPSQNTRYQVLVPDEVGSPTATEPPQLPDGEPGEAFRPLRPKSGASNALPAHLRLLWMLAFLIILIAGVAIGVALYTVYVKPMERLLH